MHVRVIICVSVSVVVRVCVCVCVCVCVRDKLPLIESPDEQDNNLLNSASYKTGGHSPALLQLPLWSLLHHPADTNQQSTLCVPETRLREIRQRTLCLCDIID